MVHTYFNSHLAISISGQIEKASLNNEFFDSTMCSAVSCENTCNPEQTCC